MSGTVRIARAILACLAPLTGDRWVGSSLVHATTIDVELPANSVAIPVMSGQIDYARALRTSVDTTVTAAGVSVPMTSLLGGAPQNFPVGTVLRWHPAIAGVELASAVNVSTTPGVDSVGSDTLKRLVIYEQIGGPTAARDLFQAKVGTFPAGVISWDGSPSIEAMGSGRVLVTDRWVLAVVSSRQDASERRAADGADILDTATAMLIQVGAVDGLVFSAPPIEVKSRARLVSGPESYIYTLAFETHSGRKRRDDRTFAPWRLTEHNYLTGDATPTFPVIVDALYPQPPNTTP